MSMFVEYLEVTPQTKVLDVGGSLLIWQFSPVKPRLTILNITPPPGSLPGDVEWVIGDARDMPFDDRSFDVVFSNSVIEHVGDFDDQKKCANEIRRVGQRYFVQTPNYFFPVEPHFITPFIHWLPRSFSRKLLGLTARNIITRDRNGTEEVFQEVRLLKPNEMRELFPDAEIRFERFLGLPKSILAIKR
jgi:2-polyprenyl-3-methyl-5-hydroxy-6-metoxy-1,4-benzoquinol methylase